MVGITVSGFSVDADVDVVKAIAGNSSAFPVAGLACSVGKIVIPVGIVDTSMSIVELMERVPISSDIVASVISFTAGLFWTNNNVVMSIVGIECSNNSIDFSVIRDVSSPVSVVTAVALDSSAAPFTNALLSDTSDRFLSSIFEFFVGANISLDSTCPAGGAVGIVVLGISSEAIFDGNSSAFAVAEPASAVENPVFFVEFSETNPLNTAGREVELIKRMPNSSENNSVVVSDDSIFTEGSLEKDDVVIPGISPSSRFVELFVETRWFNSSVNGVIELESNSFVNDLGSSDVFILMDGSFPIGVSVILGMSNSLSVECAPTSVR